MRFDRRVIWMLAMLFAFSLSTSAQELAPAFPREGAEKVLENDNFAIWKVKWEKGKSTGMHKLVLDQVTVILSDGAIKVTSPDGTWSIAQMRLGAVRFDQKGAVVAEEGLSDEAGSAVVFQLKDTKPIGYPVTESVPDMFPRVGGVLLFETDRISVWDATWKPGERIGRHMHYRRSAFVFIEGGRIRSITDQGVPEPPFARKRGDVVSVNPRKDPHGEEEVEGTPRAIWVGFK